ncbi:MAG: hypothetical protein AB7S81_04625 [Bdellovibrionales bacterium]
MTQKENYNLVRQTLTDLLQSKYEPQRKAAKAALDALTTLGPFIFPELREMPNGYDFQQLSYSYKYRRWFCTFVEKGTPPRKYIEDNGNSPRDAFMAVCERIEREKGMAA